MTSINPPIQFLPIDQIVVGKRRRTDDGDIAALAASIQAHGVFHPLIVDDERRLIAGGRRLKALQQLGFIEAPVRLWGTLTETERRELELEENLQRKDLTPAERSRVMVRLAETAREVDQETFVPTRDETNGRPEEPGSLRRVSERIGIPRETIHRAEQHVEIIDAYPAFERPDWKQYHVLEAREHLRRLPEEERRDAVALIDQPGIPPQHAVPVLANVAGLPKDERRELYRLNASEDSRDRSLALTRAAERPSMPDPRLIELLSIQRTVRRMATQFPGDPANDALATLAEQIGAVIAALKGATA